MDSTATPADTTTPAAAVPVVKPPVILTEKEALAEVTLDVHGKEVKTTMIRARVSLTLTSIIDEVGTATPIPIPYEHSTVDNINMIFNVWAPQFIEGDGRTGCSVIYPEVQEQDKYRTDNITDFDKKLMADLIDQGEKMGARFDPLIMVTMTANYLDIKPLLELTCKTIANNIKGKSPEEVKELFKIPPISKFYKPPTADSAAVTVPAAVPTPATATAAAAATLTSAAPATDAMN